MPTFDEMYRSRLAVAQQPDLMTTPMASQTAAPSQTAGAIPARDTRFNAMVGQIGTRAPMAAPAPAAPAPAAQTNPMVPSRGTYMGYGPNAGGMRLDPNYLPEQWDYKQSPEYQNRLKWATKDLNRMLLSMGRSDSTGGINAQANLMSRMAAEEIDKQYGRALNANMVNYGRYTGANTENYGRTRAEDQTGWDRAAYLGNQDWNRNYQLADLGFRATQSGVGAGNAAGANLANLLSQNGANQASLALQKGVVSADQIQSLLNAGWTYLQINSLFGQGSGGAANAPGYSMPAGPGAPQLPYYNAGGVGAPSSDIAYGGPDYFEGGF